jgi:cytochrome P450 family 135
MGLDPLLRTPTGWQMLRYLLDPDGFFASAHRRHGDIFTVKMLGARWVILAHPEHIGRLFTTAPDGIDAGEAAHMFRLFIGTGNMLLLDGEEYLHRRRIVLPAFHGDRMRSYESIVRRTAVEELSTWPLGEPFPAFPRVSRLVFRVILLCVLGLDETEQVRPLADALMRMVHWITDPRRVLTFFALGPERVMSLPGYRKMIAELDRCALAEIESRRNALDLHEREDVLSMLICARDEHGAGLTDRELRDELVTLLFAGHENTSSLIAWALHELARDPPRQERLAAEGAPYADAVVSETLRLRPPVPLLARRLRAPLELAGRELPAGTNICPCTLLAHRRPDTWPEPRAFRPERFLDAKPAPGAWFPFGGGIRRCVGAAFARFEARITLEEIARALRLTADPRPERVYTRAIVLVPARGARITAVRRVRPPAPGSR